MAKKQFVIWLDNGCYEIPDIDGSRELYATGMGTGEDVISINTLDNAKVFDTEKEAEAAARPAWHWFEVVTVQQAQKWEKKGRSF
jgi:hypothetical protein